MKIPFSSVRPWLAISLLAAPSSQAAVPEEPLFGAVSSAIFALTLTTPGPGTVAKDGSGKPLPKSDPESGPDSTNAWTVVKNGKAVEQVEEIVMKNVMTKYSNKELLQDLVSFGAIDDIKGWSVVRVQATENHPGREPIPHSTGPLHLYITHKTKSPICLTPYIKLTSQINETGVIVNFKSVTRLNAQEQTISHTETYSMGFKGAGYCHVRFTKSVPGAGGASQHTKRFKTSTLYSGGEKLVLFGPDKIPVLVPLAGKMGSVIGTHSYSKQPEDSFVGGCIEGSIAFGAGSPRDLAAFPESKTAVGFFPAD